MTDILGENPAIDEVRVAIRQVAPTDTPVLILGDTGVGKDLVAEWIHRLSPRSDGPLIQENCGRLNGGLLESALFGHEKGAFTGAGATHAGLFEMADGGTLFLDEICTMRSGLQISLLRVLEGKPFRRIGGEREIRADVRLIAASNGNLEADVQSGRFRRDLYYRVSGFIIRVPPLCDRGGDIALMASAFLERYCEELRKEPMRLTESAERLVARYQWPGNVRELEQAIKSAVIRCDGKELGVQHLPKKVRDSASRDSATGEGSESLPSVAELKRMKAERAITDAGGNKSEAAVSLGISRNTLRKWLSYESSAGSVK